jgi:hypothetical protein
MADNNYKDSKVISAMWELVFADKPFRDRVRTAHLYLLQAKGRPGFEHEFEVVENCFRTVQNADYSHVTDKEFRTVAEVIFELYGRVIKSEPLIKS